MLVTAILQAHQPHLVRMVLVRNAVVKHKKAIGRKFNHTFDLLPDIIRRYIVILQIAIDGVMRKMLMMIGKPSLRVIRLRRNEKLTVITAYWLHVHEV
ncbi:hypothetical protein D8B25_14055 [Verminephrobacter aporrectodeae subsp. tuberculatae]|nr:hypothetical protein [Verminephrobacter aporrectodeae subsp. tuberculatae]MCW8176461.1 hypothetical protein [Verminephrobacter aporrectodeae subsp. tuberculatae]